MKQYKTTNDYLKIVRTLNHLKRMGVQTIKKDKNKLLRIFGLIFLGVAIIPNGLGIIFLPLSLMCLGISKADLKRNIILYKRKGKHLIKYYMKKQSAFNRDL